MRSPIVEWTFVVLFIYQGTAWSQEMGVERLSGHDSKPSMELAAPETDIAIYETELRYRMIVQLIGFIVALGVLHLIQVKLKINRAYFWFVVGGVILMFALTSYLPKSDPNKPRPQTDDSPTYAPTHAQ
ncbi:hypothetical protein K2Y11_23925 [bacterium]|nr:hypothetical protein [bacterium]